MSPSSHAANSQTRSLVAPPSHAAPGAPAPPFGWSWEGAACLVSTGVNTAAGPAGASSGPGSQVSAVTVGVFPKSPPCVSFTQGAWLSPGAHLQQLAVRLPRQRAPRSTAGTLRDSLA